MSAPGAPAGAAACASAPTAGRSGTKLSGRTPLNLRAMTSDPPYTREPGPGRCAAGPVAEAQAVDTARLWLRLARARADCALQRAAGDLDGLQVSCFVVTTLEMRLAHRLRLGMRAVPAAPGAAG